MPLWHASSFTAVADQLRHNAVTKQSTNKLMSFHLITIYYTLQNFRCPFFNLVIF